MEDTFSPVLRKDIYFNDLYGNENCIFGCISQDSYALLKKSKLSYYKEFFDNLDGSNDLLNLSNMGFGSIEEIGKVIVSLQKKGFLEGYPNISTFNEAEVMSIKIKEFNFTIDEKYQNICIFIRKSYKYIMVLMCFILIYILKKSDYVFSYENNFNYYNGTYVYIIVNLLTPIAFIFHEIAHRITGRSYGLETGSMSVALFWGCIPMFYVKQRAIYSLKRKKFLQVLIAGILGNILLGSICLIFAILFQSTVLYYFAICNYRMIYVNLLPISLSDGYFIMCILSKTPNIRLYMYKVLVNPKFIFQIGFREKVFCILMILFMFVIIYFEIFWFLSFIYYFSVRVCASIVFFLIYMIIIRRRSLKYINKII